MEYTLVTSTDLKKVMSIASNPVFLFFFNVWTLMSFKESLKITLKKYSRDAVPFRKKSENIED